MHVCIQRCVGAACYRIAPRCLKLVADAHLELRCQLYRQPTAA